MLCELIRFCFQNFLSSFLISGSRISIEIPPSVAVYWLPVVSVASFSRAIAIDMNSHYTCIKLFRSDVKVNLLSCSVRIDA